MRIAFHSIPSSEIHFHSVIYMSNIPHPLAACQHKCSKWSFFVLSGQFFSVLSIFVINISHYFSAGRRDRIHTLTSRRRIGKPSSVSLTKLQKIFWKKAMQRRQPSCTCYRADGCFFMPYQTIIYISTDSFVTIPVPYVHRRGADKLNVLKSVQLACFFLETCPKILTLYTRKSRLLNGRQSFLF